jgi:hypothetical protein
MVFPKSATINSHVQEGTHFEQAVSPFTDYVGLDYHHFLLEQLPKLLLLKEHVIDKSPSRSKILVPHTAPHVTNLLRDVAGISQESILLNNLDVSRYHFEHFYHINDFIEVTE